MAETVSVREAFVDVVQEGDRWRGYITAPWFRYLVASNPEGFGTGTGVLHGNPTGSPTWGPVDLTTDVTGVLPAANGGLGGITGIAGGLLYATGASSYSVTAAGTAHQVLHGGATPGWAAVDLALDTTGQISLATQATGVLPVVHGGTGTTTSTGTGSVVLDTGASINNALIGGATFVFSSATVLWNQSCPVTYLPDASLLAGHVLAGNSNVVAINNAGFTDLCTSPAPLFFVLHDKTSGGTAMGILDPGGLSTVANTIAGVNITFDLITLRLKAQVTAGASPRNLSTYFVILGA